MNAPKKSARHRGGGRGGHAETTYNGKFTTAAKHYVRAGYRVVPLHPRGKKPWLPEWTSAASTDPKTIEGWWEKRPDSNLGLMPPEGCIVVDVDPRNGGSAEGLGLPENTPTQRTGGGGTHFVVRVPKGARLPKVPGVDYIEPGKRQFVAWPSVHPDTGKQYEWEPGREPWAVKPALWRPPGDVAGASQAGLGGSPGLAPLPLHRQAPPHLSCDLLRAMGLVVNARAPERWGAHCRDSWLHEWMMPVHYETVGSDEGREVAREISALFSGFDPKDFNNEWRSLGKAPGGEKRTGASLERVVLEVLGSRAAVPAGELQIQDAKALVAKRLPEVRVLLDGLVTSGLMLLSGQPKIGKSWMVLDLILALAQGARFWGHAAQRRCRVLYLALEDNERRLQKRLNLLWVAGAGDPAFDYLLEAPRVGAGLEEQLRARVLADKLDLIVIDTLAAVRPQDVRGRSAWQADYESVQALKRLADELNIAVLVVTHNSKGGSDGMAAQNAIAATGGLMAGVDGWWVLEHTGRQTDREQPLYKLTVEHRDLPGGEFAVTFDKGSARWLMLGPWGDVLRGETQQVILEALKDNPAGLTAKELSDATGKGHQAISICLSRMRKQQLVVTTAAGKNSLPHQ